MSEMSPIAENAAPMMEREGVEVVIRDCIELADCARRQTGCAETCGCTDCDLRETVHRLPAALAAHDERVRADERERLAGEVEAG